MSTKAKNLARSWPVPETNGNSKMNGDHVVLSSDTEAGTDDDDEENEDALFGLSKRKRRKNLNDHGVREKRYFINFWTNSNKFILVRVRLMNGLTKRRLSSTGKSA